MSTLGARVLELSTSDIVGVSDRCDVVTHSILTQFASAQPTIKATPHPAKPQIYFLSMMHPTLFLPTGFQLAATVLLVIVPVRLYQSSIRAYSNIRINLLVHRLHSRSPPPSYILLGIFSFVTSYHPALMAFPD